MRPGIVRILTALIIAALPGGTSVLVASTTVTLTAALIDLLPQMQK